MFDLSLKHSHATPSTNTTSTKGRLAELFLQEPPSGKIRLAIADLEAAERSQFYEINMDTWHAPDTTGAVCYVCFAGAVMANRHPIEPHQTYVGPLPPDGPNEFSTNARWDDLFSALDELRSGYVEAFLTIDGTMPNDKVVAFAMAEAPDDPFDCFPGHINYGKDPSSFKKWARSIASKLETFGY